MISIYDWFGYLVPIMDRYKCIKNAGFDGVLLTGFISAKDDTYMYYTPLWLPMDVGFVPKTN